MSRVIEWQQLCCPKCKSDIFNIWFPKDNELNKDESIDSQDSPAMCRCINCDHNFVASYF